MNQKNWQGAYEPVSVHLNTRVQSTLAGLEEASPILRHIPLRTAVLAAVLVLALAGAAVAVFHSQVASLFGWTYGGTWEQELLAGEVDSERKTYQLGEVVYTIEEMVYKTEGDHEGLYGAVRVTPAEGSNIVLIASDYSIHEPSGYLIHYGEEEIPEDALSYAELATERNAKIIMARLTVQALMQNGTELGVTVGEGWLAQSDGSLLCALEIPNEGYYEKAEQYELNLWISNWEVDLDGYWLREEPENTWLKEDWTVMVTPTVKGE